MLRRRRFLQVMHRLALMGALLMAIAPVVSRWMQSDVGNDPLRQLAALCTTRGLQQVGLDAAMASMHAAHMTSMEMASMDMAMPGMDHGHAGDMPMDQHDGMVCDYCVLAANLLALMLVLLVLPLLQHAAMRLPLLRIVPRAAGVWPAHGARGPPDTLPV